MQRPAPWWLRALLLVGALEAIAIGASGLLDPQGSLFASLLPITVSPLNGRVIGAFYLAGAAGLLASLPMRRAHDMRLFVIGFGFIAGSLLIVTLAYWDEFTVDHIPYGWLASYVIEPVVAAVAVIVYGLARPAAPGPHRWTPLFVVEGVVFAVIGVVMLIAPGTAVDLWPWALTTLLARVYAPFFLGFALGALLAAWERRAAVVLPLATASLTLMLLLLVASLQHRDRFTGAGEWVWFAGLALGALAFGTATFWPPIFPAGEREAEADTSPATGVP
jgi:hypothetical protein